MRELLDIFQQNRLIVAISPTPALLAYKLTIFAEKLQWRDILKWRSTNQPTSEMWRSKNESEAAFENRRLEEKGCKGVRNINETCLWNTQPEEDNSCIAVELFLCKSLDYTVNWYYTYMHVNLLGHPPRSFVWMYALISTRTTSGFFFSVAKLGS